MNYRNPTSWALIGFGLGAIAASATAYTGFLDALLNGLLSAAIFYGISLVVIRRTKSAKIKQDPSWWKASIVDPQGFKTGLICSTCESIVPEGYSKCFECEGRIFIRKKIFPGVPLDINSENLDPEFQRCPMCAEQIKFAAKKCRYCGSMIGEGI